MIGISTFRIARGSEVEILVGASEASLVRAALLQNSSAGGELHLQLQPGMAVSLHKSCLVWLA